MGRDEVHFLMRSRKRATRGEKRHEHLVLWNPREKTLACTCPGFHYRKVCAGTREVLLGRVR